MFAMKGHVCHVCHLSFHSFFVGVSCVVAKWEARVDGLNQHRSIYTGTDFFL